MACGATLKRTLEFDPLHSPSQTPPVKRRRCMPLTMSMTPPPTKLHQLSPSPFAAARPKMTKEEIAARIGSELKRMQRRKQLFHANAHSSPLSTCATLGRQSPPLSLEALTSATGSSDFPFVLSQSESETSSPRQKDVPLFTFRQVSVICERLVKEHEEKLRENYDKVLSNKLSEQYEAFLKFNHDQLQKRFGNAPMSSMAFWAVESLLLELRGDFVFDQNYDNAAESDVDIEYLSNLDSDSDTGESEPVKLVMILVTDQMKRDLSTEHTSIEVCDFLGNPGPKHTPDLHAASYDYFSSFISEEFNQVCLNKEGKISVNRNLCDCIGEKNCCFVFSENKTKTSLVRFAAT